MIKNENIKSSSQLKLTFMVKTCQQQQMNESFQAIQQALNNNKHQMQNNGTIPNVSTVFRQLVKISSTNPQLNTKNQAYHNFRSTNNYINYNHTYDSNRNNDNKQQSLFPSSIIDNDRQQRHEALMGRLRNSVQENRQLLGVQESPMGRTNNPTYGYERPQVQVSQFNSNDIYSRNQFGGFGDGLNDRQKGGKWAPPKLKYRHIQDIQQNSAVSIQNNNRQSRNSTTNDNKQQTCQLHPLNLKEQFYQQQLPSQHFPSQNKQKKQRRVSNQINQSQQVNRKNLNTNNYYQQDQQEQNMNKLSIMSQKPSKYNQNLQSYYDICRKPIKTLLVMASRNEERTTNTDKFMRKQLPKVQGINLQKAMRILSLDD